jgi:small subunit ribosomal protein S15
MQSSHKSKVTSIVKDWQIHSEDTSSSDVQIGLLTDKIYQIEEKIKHIPKEDKARNILVRVKLITAVGERRKIINYLRNTDVIRYRRALVKLGMKY